MSNLLFIILGWGVGLSLVGWPLMQVYYSFIVGWPIAKRFEKIDGVRSDANPSRVYLIGGLINMLILAFVLIVILIYGNDTFLKGVLIGAIIIFIKMIFGTKKAAIEVFNNIQDDLNEYGKFVAQDDLRRHQVK